MTHCGLPINGATIYPRTFDHHTSHNDQSTSVIRAYKNISEEFAVTSGIHQGCVLAPTPSNLFFDAVIRTAIDDHLEEGMGCELYSTLTLSSLVIEGR